MKLFPLLTLLLVVPEVEINRRIELDFNKDLHDILPYIQQYYSNVDSVKIAEWEQSGALEYTIINGEKRYFRNAAQNLFRIDKEARKIKEIKEGNERMGREYIIKNHIEDVFSVKKHKNEVIFSNPQTWEFAFTVEINRENLQQKDDTLSVWLPYPRSDVNRQKGVEVLYSNCDLTISDSTGHSTAFVRLSGNQDRVDVKYRFSTRAEYHSLPKKFKHRKADPSNPDLAEYLEERKPHCIFSTKVRELADSIVGNETRPYFQARKLFEAMRRLYPWASAREYGTIENIPDYVIEQRHGDCGQISLLYIAMCRYKGIPARWQSGFMLHPGYENLHDWAEIYIEGMGWIPVDPSFGVREWGKNDEERYFYFGGIDAFRLVVNTDWGRELYPTKKYERSEPVDFQRGEVETKTKNLYFDVWKYRFNVVSVL